MSYCTLSDLKAYLGIPDANTTSDVLLQRLLDNATYIIDSKTQKTFQAGADTTRYFDPSCDVISGELWLDAPLSYLTSVINGDPSTTNITTSVYTNPRNTTPYYSLGIKTSSSYTWEYDDDTQNAITVTGRWAWMDRYAITALSRSTNVVTATLNSGNLFVGQTVYVVGCADATFNGSFTLTAVNAASVTWAQTASNDTDTTATLLACPAGIVQACRRLSAWLYRQKDTAQSGTETPILTADGTVLMPSTLPADVLDLLQPFTAVI